ncbi:putative indole-3-pyruvate monooxygenase YUCCA11 [Raphanus sativus]|uniref:indole-3-pyruvate monooxygenase n=1 Tax=Raphanus sativus TaxID=3726 RepID=A0A6J0JL46_RAPSA|nr:probable indole-3-pyruvate monooxygenase YUCCA11 [Raphanus sativus]KAJ4891922.1 putative indole-3-pyruvate monooxygenase YUCCA11 [Raphanus sativus]
MSKEIKSIDTVALIIGARPAGLATSACLNRLNIPNIVAKREECNASLWKRRSYDCLKLHFAKKYCELPNMRFPPKTPTFVSKSGLVSYIKEYATRFNVSPRYNRNVKYVCFKDGRWVVEVDNSAERSEVYSANYLVVATGENSEGVIPGLVEGFEGEYLHSSEYKKGEKFAEKHVLVVGSGNSGMEIAYDASKWDANVSLVVHSPVDVLTREIVRIGMWLLRFFPVKLVDRWCLLLAKLRFGDTSRYGLIRPDKGSFMINTNPSRHSENIHNPHSVLIHELSKYQSHYFHRNSSSPCIPPSQTQN